MLGFFFLKQFFGEVERGKEATMIVKQLMQKDVITCSPSETIHQAAVKMKQYDIGSVLIVEDGSKLKGILTDRDIALKLGAESKDPETTFVSDIMTPNPVSINLNADVDEALKAMNTANVRRLPVMEDGNLVGLLSSADVATEIKEELDQFIGLEGSLAKRLL